MRKCPFCHGDIGDAAIVCPHCRRATLPGPSSEPAVASPPRSATRTEIEHAPALPSPILRVTVVDVNMPFASMVGFMVKWAIAAIPAVLILGVLAVFGAALFAAVFHR
jgi:hypothetical protein